MSGKRENTLHAVEEILDTRTNGRTREFLVKWAGHPDSDNSWELESNLNCPELLKKFRDKRKKPIVLRIIRKPRKQLNFSVTEAR